MSAAASTAEPPSRASADGASPAAGAGTRVAAAFLAPGARAARRLVVYPTICTIVRSFFDRSGDDFVGLDNYKDALHRRHAPTAIKNNVIWVAVVPAFVTALGLIFAVLTERIALVGRVQDRRLHADGDLALRRRHDLADDVRAGPDQGARQRRRSRSSTTRSSPAGRARRRRSPSTADARRAATRRLRPRRAGAARADARCSG